jgi:hypothetical protein
MLELIGCFTKKFLEQFAESFLWPGFFIFGFFVGYYFFEDAAFGSMTTSQNFLMGVLIWYLIYLICITFFDIFLDLAIKRYKEKIKH